MRVTAGGPESPRGHMQPSSMVDRGGFLAFESIKIIRVQIQIETFTKMYTDLNCYCVGVLHHYFWLQFV